MPHPDDAAVADKFAELANEYKRLRAYSVQQNRRYTAAFRAGFRRSEPRVLDIPERLRPVSAAVRVATFDTPRPWRQPTSIFIYSEDGQLLRGYGASFDPGSNAPQEAV